MIKIKSITVAYNTFFSVILFFLALILAFRGVYNSRIMLYGIIFYVTLFIGIAFFVFFPYKDGVIQDITEWDFLISGSVTYTYNPTLSSNFSNLLFGAFRFPLILSVASKVFHKKDVKHSIDIGYKISDVVVCYGLFEVICKKLIKVKFCGSFVSFLFGDIGLSSNNSVRLSGFTKEPSHYAVVLFVYSILMIIILRNMDNGLSKYRVYFKLAVIYLLMFFSGSLSAYYLLIISFLCLLSIETACKKFGIALVVISCVAIFISVGISESLIERFERIKLVFSTILSGKNYHSFLTSEGARLTSIYQMIKCFLSRPFWGVGLGVTDAHSSFFSLLGNIGLFGILFYYLIWKEFGNVCTTKENLFFILVISSTLLAGGLGAFMDLYFPFLLLLYSSTRKSVVLRKYSLRRG